jgi:uncharacterized membrane protein
MDGTERMVVWILAIGETLVLGGLFFLAPRITRRGLLFGVYVGEALSVGEEARRITRSWYREGACWLAVSLATCVLAGLLAPSPLVALAGVGVLLVGFSITYYRAYRRARDLAPPQSDLSSAAPLVAEPPHLDFVPLVVGAVTLLCGLFALSYALTHYESLPSRIPVHFGLSGRPDGWADKSLPTILLLPLLALVLGPALCCVAALVGHAKTAIRFPDPGLSLAAQRRFRTAMVRYVCGVAFLATLLLTELSVSAIRVGLGETEKLPAVGNVLIVALVVYALGSLLYIALRLGQGGARLEGPATAAALTNGLADNRSWVLGVFYVNRDDPSILVEHRFGLGYTLNFGNWKSVAGLVGFLAVVLTIMAWALLAS